MGANLEKILDKAAQDGTKELDLKGKGISKVPANLGKVKELIRLNMSINKVLRILKIDPN